MSVDPWKHWLQMSRPGRAALSVTPSGNHGRIKIGAVLLAALVVLGFGASPVPRVAAAASPAGGVRVWFDDDAGQYCNGTITRSGHKNFDSKTPVPSRLAPSTAVAAGQSHTLAIDPTGAVFACGQNANGQLGSGNLTRSFTPVRVALPNGVVITAVASGWRTNLAVTSTGSLYAWGMNQYGQVGDGSNSDRTTPLLVHLPVGVTVTAIAVGQYHSLAVTSTGAVYAWGFNGFGQLGNGTTAPSATPVLVPLPAGVIATAVGAGDNHSLVVTSTGSVYAFGKNSFGQLGNGGTVQSTVPVQVSLPAGVQVSQVAAGGISPSAKLPDGDYSLAITTNGKVYAWGAGTHGQLGNNTLTNSDVPVVTQLPPGEIATAVGGGPNFGHVLTTDGNIFFWGTEGSGVYQHLVPTPTLLPTGLHAAAVSAGPDGEQIAAVFVP